MIIPFVLGAAAAALTYGIRQEERQAGWEARNMGCRCLSPRLRGASLG
jgi:hypothetical protein